MLENKVVNYNTFGIANILMDTFVSIISSLTYQVTFLSSSAYQIRFNISLTTLLVGRCVSVLSITRNLKLYLYSFLF